MNLGLDILIFKEFSVLYTFRIFIDLLILLMSTDDNINIVKYSLKLGRLCVIPVFGLLALC
jgi:hypothetical protein